MDIAQEPIAACRAEIEAIATVQWAETGDQGAPLAPHWDLFFALEKVGAGFILVGRDQGRLVGYMGIMLHPQSSSIVTRQATISTYWVEPAANRALRLRQMFKTAIDAVKAHGVWRVAVDTNIEHSCGRLLEALGFQPRSMTYVLPLEVQNA